MKITIIRHAKVNYKWKFWYNSEGFNKACYEYDTSPIDDLKKYNINTSNPIYISDLSRTFHTAKLIFGEAEFNNMNLFNEVQLNAFIDTKIMLPAIIWRAFGRLQWYGNSSKQMETKNETLKRAKKAIDFLEGKNEDCYVVCHACYMRVLLKELKRRGYTGNYSNKHIENLQKFVLVSP